ncbi:hypothetical protein [uncultured Reyranella sp.]|jgi:hypothetical protein|uniref:hypothetical protein n=1 Tax=uncultured Reyranella sp. TaxID=735512 RepID=UPI00259CF763|nr:hypothetical protein [uncultured Reyranella sp.]
MNNTHMACHVAGCGQLRTRRGRYCRPHARRLNAFGNPNGRHLRKEAVSDYVAQARRILLANIEHEGVSLAIKELQGVLTDASERATNGLALTRTDQHWSRLAAHNVAPLDILSVAAGVILYDRADPRFFARNNSYVFAIARAVLGLAPRGDMPMGSQTLQAIGGHVVERYSALILSVERAANQTAAHEEARGKAMSTPMRPATTQANI